MTAPEFDPLDRGKSESDPTLLKQVAMCNGVKSRASAEVIDSEGRCNNMRTCVSHDTATNNSYPTLMMDKVAVSETKGVMPSNEAAVISLAPEISCLDSCADTTQTPLSTSTQAPSCLFSRKGDMAACLDEPNDYTVKAMVVGIMAA